MSSTFYSQNPPATLQTLWQEGRRRLNPQQPRIHFGSATCGRAAGAQRLWWEAQQHPFLGQECLLVQTGCMGACFAEPLVDVRLPSGMHYTYGNLEAKHLELIAAAAQGEPPPIQRATMIARRSLGP